jgi:pimeloyl-ACP methyl ester carboxylesterase
MRYAAGMDDAEPEITWLTRPDGVRLAMRHDPGDGPGIVFVHGLMSHMQGEKARFLSRHARTEGWDCLRLDLSGHGRSEGALEACSIGGWRDDVLLALDRHLPQRAILVGSSIGGWIALLAALARPERVAGLLLIAPAPDMTRRVAASLPREAREALAREGVWLLPSRYGVSILVTRHMLDDGERLCLLDGPIALSCPVRILHGQLDPDVPWQGSLRLAECLRSADVQTILLKQGDHRLSRPHELALLIRSLGALRDTVRDPARAQDATGTAASS